jgi:N-acetylmuramic acid 6-phosphate etherase
MVQTTWPNPLALNERKRRSPMTEFDQLSTEQARPGFDDLDLRSTLDLVLLMNDDDAAVAGAVRRAAEQIAAAVDAIAARLEGGGRFISIGAGTAGRVAALDAVECAPTFGVDPGVFVAILAGGPAAFLDANEGDEDDGGAAVAALAAAGLTARDVVVSISASGRTPYAVEAARHAREVGALVVGVVCNADAELSRVADIAIETPVGPEFVTGSTRLKSGTAQKLVLNMLSTLVMVRLGRTYGSWMVGVQATNAKLRARARRILVEATGLEAAEVAGLLADAGGDLRTALVMALASVDADEARSRLAASGGRVRAAVYATPR